MHKRKILVIYTGGTFGMNESLQVPELSSVQLKKRLLSQVPEMGRIAKCDVRVLYNTDSCQMSSKHWLGLAHFLKKHQRAYDGVVILHGTDTLAYTAAALSFLLGSNPVPVVITGAQKPLAMIRNDARTNFLSAIEVAAFAPKALRNRVMVLFHDELYLGSRVRKKSALSFAAFESPRFPSLAKIGSEIRFEEIVQALPKLKAGLNLETALASPQILRTEITPEFPARAFTEALGEKIDAVLMTLYPSATAPTENLEFKGFLDVSKQTHTPLFAITEREDAPTQLASYQAGRTLLKHSVIWCNDLTPEAAFVKAWLLRCACSKQTRAQFYDWIHKNWATPLSDETSEVGP